MTTRTLTPKQVVVAEYLALYEYHCEREQLERAGEAPMLWCVHEGTAGWDPTPIERAEDHHRAALLLLWSMDAEQQDPWPPGLAPSPIAAATLVAIYVALARTT